jgi:NADH:ubiquinone oxidoreductase subunit 4 (subunit M)
VCRKSKYGKKNLGFSILLKILAILMVCLIFSFTFLNLLGFYIFFELSLLPLLGIILG